MIIFDIECAFKRDLNELSQSQADRSASAGKDKIQKEISKAEEKIASLSRQSSIDTWKAKLEDLQSQLAEYKTEEFVPQKEHTMNPLTSIITALVAYNTYTGEKISELAWDLESEKRLLRNFCDFSLTRYGNEFMGFNIRNFDLPFLTSRMVMQGLAPKFFSNIPKKYDAKIIDIMDMTAGPSKFVSQSDLCLAAGVPPLPEDSPDGSDMQDLFDSGDYQKILRHCDQDVWQLVYLATLFNYPVEGSYPCPTPPEPNEQTNLSGQPDKTKRKEAL